MAFPTYLFLWLLGIVLIIISWYAPNAQGFFWLGGLSLAFGVVLALLRRG